MNELLKKAEDEESGNALIIEENEESNESDDNYVKAFINWSADDINNYHKKKYGYEDSPISRWRFAILSNESASEDKLEICSNSQIEDKFTVHRVRSDLGSSCLICSALGTLDVEVSSNL